MPPAHLANLDIMLPFYAYLLKGARFINKPLLKYRIHGQNGSLSLMAERAADPVEKLRIHERIYLGHLVHAVTMLQELDRAATIVPERYAQLVPAVGPLLTIQTVEMAKKLVATRKALWEAAQSGTGVGGLTLRTVLFGCGSKLIVDYEDLRAARHRDRRDRQEYGRAGFRPRGGSHRRRQPARSGALDLPLHGPVLHSRLPRGCQSRRGEVRFSAPATMVDPSATVGHSTSIGAGS